jgi:hypothetical protein
MVKFSSHVEEPLTRIEKDRARTMMRNNHIFQSLGLPAIVAMLRKSNEVQEDSAITTGSASPAFAITHGRSSDYCPKDDKVMDDDEVDESLVKKVKVHSLLSFWRGGNFCAACKLVFLSCYAHDLLTPDLMYLSFSICMRH